MQTGSEIARILNALTVGQTVTVKYVVRNQGFNASNPFERWVNVTIDRVGADPIYGSAYSAETGRSDVYLRTKHGQNLVRVNFGEWHVITGADSPFVK